MCAKNNVRLVIEAFDSVKIKYPFALDVFVILPDHMHCIWTLPENDNDFSTRWRLIKGYFSRWFDDKDKYSKSLSRISKGEQAIWQRCFWEHTIKDDGDFKKHVEYIHYNSVKHGLVTSAGDWIFTSFHEYVSRSIYSSDWGASCETVFEDVGHE